MKNVIVTDPPRTAVADLDLLAEFGVATVHEAFGRTGLVGASLRPLQEGARIAGSAVTVLCWPGDNLMIHAAIEQCRDGDILIVTTTSPSLDGSFGELFATQLQRRGVRGLVTTGGVRDAVDLRSMGFHVWSAAVNAQGTVKATPGAVNVPVIVGGVTVNPGDAVIADDDGVMVVPRLEVARALEASQARTDKEAAARAAYLEGVVSMDQNKLRGVLADLGVTYEPYTEA
ncbi:4-carboxy-4-hydroxy-2-oxoadipate aldolase/oxaloacetate decarboxylase [Pseudolysinimonas sp.]|uniref:4-carboxy-4-hydroxy-2-oxoadipate aldolase/oxaloacetate decarboxylase n=1 Tax=Pseudolysinimonas sp. TaxID=2680009 RepID=UPI00286B49C8|nr:4-carboxy-4-hydroxy-2-oxoadipate aldolase/oxaloacetate decarboxylase [Pseudolysinimonas sp.]